MGGRFIRLRGSCKRMKLIMSKEEGRCFLITLNYRFAVNWR